MLLGGLWHGASWTFVVWGAYHGVLLAVDRALEPKLIRIPTLIRRWGTFVLVVVGWVFFRSDSFSMAFTWLGKMAGVGTLYDDISVKFVLLIVLAFAACNIIPETWHMKFPLTRRWTVIYAFCFFVAYLFMNGAHTVFLYFQF
jgi:alginate O-acetyltransferase complex protein AlgI